MTAFNQETSLFCIFHNHGRYLLNDEPISHVYSGIVQEENGSLEVILQDFDGEDRSISTDISGKQFNLAAMVPIPRATATIIKQVVDKLNTLNKIDRWPFYFSPDMSLVTKYETKNRASTAPEGHIDPPLHMQDAGQYGGDGQRLLSRINCVRMALMTARMAGINIPNIAQINPLSNTGEEVRDRIHQAYMQLMTVRDGRDNFFLTDNFTAKKKGVDKSEARFTLAPDGLCIVKTEKKDFRMGGLCDALAAPVLGKSLFNWISEGRLETFKDVPFPVPTYLQKILSLE